MTTAKPSLLADLPDAEVEDLLRDWIGAEPGEPFLTFEPHPDCPCADCVAALQNIEVDWERSKVLASEIRAEEKNCWGNAIDTVMHIWERLPLDGDAYKRLFYVEGYASAFGIPHAWVELEGVILDPTFALFKDDPGVGSYAGACSYRAVRRYSCREVEDREDEQGGYPAPFTVGLWERKVDGRPSPTANNPQAAEESA